MSRADRAFTLLEVLAAVALLGIVYATLARVSIEGLRARHGDQIGNNSTRRLWRFSRGGNVRWRVCRVALQRFA